MPKCWLTVDDTDRDAIQLWSDVISALETVVPGCGEGSRDLLHHPGGVLAAVDQLVEDLDTCLVAPTVLVIDDFHLVDDDEVVAASLAYFVEALPGSLHAVVCSRRAPGLSLDRLRARGRLGEVHFAQLKFSPSEGAEMLKRLSPAMSDDQVRTTVSRVDGWAAGVQLAALAARSASASASPELSGVGADLLIHDYVWHEVLSREDPDLVQTMSDTAVVDRIDPGLGLALTGRTDVTDLLLKAEERGLFVTRLGTEGWFELHALVRAALLGEMARTAPGRIAGLHMRAARWFEGANEVALALEHWLLAGDLRSALRLLSAKHGELYDTGRETTIRRTIAAIPVEAAAVDLETMIEFAWCHLLVGRRRFVELVEQLSWLAERVKPEATLRGRVTILQSEAEMMTGHWTRSGALARQALREFGDSWWKDPLGRFVWNTVARELALAESWDDGAKEAREAEQALSRDPPRRVAFEGTRALGQALAGRPVDALRVAAGVCGSVAVDSMTILRAELSLAEAIARREIGDRSRALVELETLAEAPAETMLYCRILAMLELVQATLDDGQPDAAKKWLVQAESLIDGESFGIDMRQRLAVVGTKLALAGHDIDWARKWANQIDDPFWGPVSAARVSLGVGDQGAAFARLGSATARCPRHQVILALLQARSIEDRDAVIGLVADAAEDASASGLLQSVVSEGGEIIQLVERSAWHVPAAWMERLRRAAVARPSEEAPTTQEALTGRERDVLRFLPSRLTLGEIASELYISVNTLKFHLKVIYRKLGVGSRAEAAEIARNMNVGRPRAD